MSKDSVQNFDTLSRDVELFRVELMGYLKRDRHKPEVQEIENEIKFFRRNVTPVSDSDMCCSFLR